MVNIEESEEKPLSYIALHTTYTDIIGIANNMINDKSALAEFPFIFAIGFN